MNIYISNLSFTILDKDLRGFFSEYGEVSSAKIIMDRATMRSRGFGFVEMPDEQASKKAIAGLDGTTRDGRTIQVTEARPKKKPLRILIVARTVIITAPALIKISIKIF
jgi:RNA recognition motif-containing protein